MIAVSNTWKTAVKSQFRLQAYLYASLEVVPPDLITGVVAASSDTFAYSDPATMTNNSETIINKYASLNHNRWPLNGTMKLLQNNSVTEDWWANKTGALVTATFVQSHSFMGITITWDTDTNSWPTSFNIIGYRSNTVVATYNFKANSIKEFYSAPFDDINKIAVQVISWSKPNWDARITEIMFGLWVEFSSKNNGRISSAVLQDASQPLSEAQPTHDMTLVLNNTDSYFDPQLTTGVSKYIAQKQILKVWWEFYTSYGVIERTPDLSYILDTFEVPSDKMQVNFRTTNRLALLSDPFTYGNWTGTVRTLYNVATYVLEHSGVLYETSSVNPWALSSQLQNFSTRAPIPDLPTNSILQLIALAGCCYLRIRSTDGAIVFENNTSQSPAHAITTNEILDMPKGTVIDRLRSIAISVYSYTPASTTSEIGRGTYNLATAQQVRIDYNVLYATSVTASVTGATLQQAAYYASHAILTLSAGSNITVILTGTEIKVTKSMVETYRDSLVSEGIDIIVDNSLITEVSQLAQISSYIERFYKRRTRYSITYLGYPELEAGDIITLNTIYGSDQPDIVSNKITFNGGWQGTVETI